MKNILYISISFLSIFFFNSCEEAIDYDLGSNEPQVVVDAFVSNSRDSQFINISKSIPYLNNGNPTPYNVDSILIIDSSISKRYSFTKVANGKYAYLPGNDTFISGHQFYLLVFDKSDVYASFSKMGRVGVIDSLTYSDETFGNVKSKVVEMSAKDPVGKGDFIWIKQYRNDSLQTGSITTAVDNTFSPSEEGDGELYIVPLRTFLGYRTNDKATIEIYSLTAESYYYFKQIEVQLNNTAGLFAQPIANVDGNIVNVRNPKSKILGFFNVGASVKKSILIK